MQTISIRLDDKVITKIEELRGAENKSDFYRKLIEHALNTFEHKSIQLDDKVMASDDKAITTERREDIGESSRELIIELELKDKIIEAKDQTIKTLENQNGFLIAEFQRERSLNEKLLMPSQEEQKEKGKKWFEFWK
jgi:Arc/MetJ-type ribon-helix-helix transcriptional regulator